MLGEPGNRAHDGGLAAAATAAVRNPIVAEPRNFASPNGYTCPVAPTSQYPWPLGVEKPLTMECGHAFVAAPAGAAPSAIIAPTLKGMREAGLL